MSILVVGLSYKSAPVATLERAVLTADARVKLLHDVRHAADVAGCLIVNTCNRVEVYADVGKFHSAMAAICELLARHSGVPSNELTPCLYVHYEDRAVQHLLAVACGLDSMVVGESQILGQVRQALTLAREHATLDRALSELSALALRTGKRAHSETGIDRAGANLLSVGLTAAAAELGAAPDGPVPDGSGPDGSAPDGSGPDGSGLDPAAGPVLAGRSVLVVGAGSMSALAVAGTARAGATGIVVANRTPTHAKRLADTVAGTPANLTDLAGLIAAADLVISCTGASGSVITRAMVAQARSRRDRPGALVFLDLALPRDVEAGTGDLPDVAVVDLETLAASGVGGGRDADVAAVRAILGQEFEAYLSAGRAAAVAPTVVALREKAAQVVDAELARLEGRLGGLDPQVSREVARSMQRITDKLLHSPTIRVKELAGAPGGESYAAMLRVLFDLDPDAVRAVAQADAGLAGMDAEASGASAAPAPATAVTAEGAP
ncbi:MAG TPA: glutamyl-tRNA reductase [Streptosporangiaceae bacterium]|nr:glutamyl-tRNA reductase [Streptosporangiaceae bacterium]